MSLVQALERRQAQADLATPEAFDAEMARVRTDMADAQALMQSKTLASRQAGRRAYARLVAEQSGLERRARTVGEMLKTEQESAKRMEVAHALSDAFDGQARTMLGIGPDEDLPFEVARHVQDVVDGFRGGAYQTPERAQMALRDGLDQIGKRMKPEPTFQQRVDEADAKGYLSGREKLAERQMLEQPPKSAEELRMEARQKGALAGEEKLAERAVTGDTGSRRRDPEAVVAADARRAGEVVRGASEKAVTASRGDKVDPGTAFRDALAGYSADVLRMAVHDPSLPDDLKDRLREYLDERFGVAGTVDVGALMDAAEKDLGRRLTPAERDLLKQRMGPRAGSR